MNLSIRIACVSIRINYFRRATRPNYGDEAIGWVQVRRDGIFCTSKAQVCPEHKVRDKGYSVSVIIDEANERIEDAKCHDCAASEGEETVEIYKNVPVIANKLRGGTVSFESPGVVQ